MSQIDATNAGQGREKSLLERALDRVRAAGGSTLVAVAGGPAGRDATGARRRGIARIESAGAASDRELQPAALLRPVLQSPPASAPSSTPIPPLLPIVAALVLGLVIGFFVARRLPAHASAPAVATTEARPTAAAADAEPALRLDFRLPVLPAGGARDAAGDMTPIVLTAPVVRRVVAPGSEGLR